MQCTDILKREHRVIEKGLDVLEQLASDASSGKGIRRDIAEKVLDFMATFADKCHHAKEENLLFVELERHGLPRDGGPIGVMLAEHEQGRALRRTMLEALQRIESDATTAVQFSETAYAFVNLLRDHIFKEDNVLYRMAEQILTDADDARLVEAFERAEQESVGAGVHEHYHKMIHELLQEVMSPKGVAKGSC